MWVIVPVKNLQHAKQRLTSLFSQQQRARLSYLMLTDVLDTLNATDIVDGVTVISSDATVIELARNKQANCLSMDSDSGYSADAMHAVNSVSNGHSNKIAIIPSDVPQLTIEDLRLLDKSHQQGITLCPALQDGGTNAVVFTPPLQLPFLFGPDSLIRYQQCARQLKVPVNVKVITGFERDMDRPEDIYWLGQKPEGKQAWAYLQELLPEIPVTQ